MKYYAVKNGKQTGIYDSWEDCQEQITGFSGAVFKSFYTLDEAEAYLEQQEQPAPIDNNLPFAYIDGSFSEKHNMYSYGGYLFYDGKTFILQGTGDNADYTEYRNITGEVRGALEVIKKATELKIDELNLFYDYAGIEQWALGQWECKNKLTQFYKSYYDKHNVKINFSHIKGHTGNRGNEIADLLAKEALKIKLTKKQVATLDDFKNSVTL